MGRELSHDEVTDLLGAYALDALEPAERQAVDGHVRGCKGCLAEIAEHREVAGLLTPGWAKPPAGLWEKIAATLEEAPPPLDLAPVIAMKPTRQSQPGKAGGPRRSIGLGIAAMVAAAAVAMIGFLGIRVADDRRRIDQLAVGAHVEELERTANAALADPSGRKVELASTDGYRTAQAVVLPDGTGYLVKSNLPALARERTYQLWAVVGTSRISVGVLGAEPRIVPFKIDGKVSALAITDEAAGGVESTKKDPVVLGRLETA
jgi:anti-sigma factor RsiW